MPRQKNVQHEHQGGHSRTAQDWGFIYLSQIRSVYTTPDTTRPIPVGLMVLENLEGYFLHAASWFLVFFVLHALAWFASSKIRAATLQLDT
jgi:hypothetical protein